MKFDFVSVCAVLVCVSDKPMSNYLVRKGGKNSLLTGRNVRQNQDQGEAATWG